MDRLSELSDEDNLNMDEYIQLMASTTITNSINIQNGTHADGGESYSNNNNQKHFARVFELFDADGKGFIAVNDLERIATELGEHDMTQGELQEMIDRARGESGDNDDRGGRAGNRKVGIEEFTRMMTMSLFPSDDTGDATR